MEILKVVLHDVLTGNVPFVALAALVGLLSLSVVLFAVRGALAARHWRKASDEATNERDGHDAPYGANWDWDRLDGFSYNEDGGRYDDDWSPAQCQSGSGMVAYVIVLVLLVAVVAIIVGIGLSVVQSLGIETLGDGLRILASL